MRFQCKLTSFTVTSSETGHAQTSITIWSNKALSTVPAPFVVQWIAYVCRKCAGLGDWSRTRLCRSSCKKKSTEVFLESATNAYLLEHDVANSPSGHKHTYGNDGSLIGKHLPASHRLSGQVNCILAVYRKRIEYITSKFKEHTVTESSCPCW